MVKDLYPPNRKNSKLSTFLLATLALSLVVSIQANAKTDTTATRKPAYESSDSPFGFEVLPTSLHTHTREAYNDTGEKTTEIPDSRATTILSSSGPWEIINIDVPEIVRAVGDSAEVEIRVTARSTIVYMMLSIAPTYYDVPIPAEEFPILVNGYATGSSVSVRLRPGESRDFKATIALNATGELMFNPFASPSSHVVYSIAVGGLERRVAVYSYPDYTLFYFLLPATAALVTLLLLKRRFGGYGASRSAS